MNHARLTLTVADAALAKASLQPDNDQFVQAAIVDEALQITASSQSVMGLLRSLDDVLGCLRATGLE